nr:uncharacterized protein LOC108944168 [Nicotiana tomentosiformis]
MLRVHGRSERKLIMVNEFGQPVGPTKEVLMEFGSFLGTLEKYDIFYIEKNWTLEAIQGSWRRYKSQLKKDHFMAYHNDEIRMEKRPENIPAYQFKELLKYWNSNKYKKMSTTNIENRKKLKTPHILG